MTFYVYQRDFEFKNHHRDMIPAVRRYAYHFHTQLMLLPLNEHRHDDVGVVVRAYRAYQART